MADILILSITPSLSDEVRRASDSLSRDLEVLLGHNCPWGHVTSDFLGDISHPSSVRELSRRIQLADIVFGFVDLVISEELQRLLAFADDLGKLIPVVCTQDSVTPDLRQRYEGRIVQIFLEGEGYGVPIRYESMVELDRLIKGVVSNAQTLSEEDSIKKELLDAVALFFGSDEARYARERAAVYSESRSSSPFENRKEDLVGSPAPSMDASIESSSRISKRWIGLGAMPAVALLAYFFRESIQDVLSNIWGAMLPAWATTYNSSGDPVLEEIEAAIFSPQVVARNKILRTQVFLHPPGDTHRGRALEIAREIDNLSHLQGFEVLNLRVPRGASITVVLVSDNADTLAAFSMGSGKQKTVVWRGETTSVDFLLRVDARARIGDHCLTAIILYQGAAIGEIEFVVEVNDEANSRETLVELMPNSRSKKYEKVFLSYSRKDIRHVQTVARAYALLGQEYLWDIEQLRASDDFESRLLSMIERSDAVLLFWSENAKQSEWVKKEALHALSFEAFKGRPRLIPFPIEGPPIAEPWVEIRHKHIGDSAYFRNF